MIAKRPDSLLESMLASRLLPALLLAMLGLGGLQHEAFAQDEPTDDGSGSGSGESDDSDDSEDSDEKSDDAGSLDDILAPSEPSTANDAQDLKEGRISEQRVGVRQDQLEMAADDSKRKRLIKTLQKKNFSKGGRGEISPHVAFVANDPFLNRYIAGAGFGYNITEIFEIEGSFDFSPDLGEQDWKALTHQLVDNNKVSPDISKMTWLASASFLYSPIYGKAAILGRNIINFDMFGAFGMGATHTVDDCNALHGCGKPDTEVTEFQTHPTTNFGGGARIIFNQNVALRVEGRSVVYIETVQATTLEMKQNFILSGGVSLFFPRMK